jgi:hypothetical protein
MPFTSVGRAQRVADDHPASVLATAGQRLVEERAIALWSTTTGRTAVDDLIALFDADSNATLPNQDSFIKRSAEEHVFHAALMAASETPSRPHFAWTLSPARQWMGLDVPGSRFGQDNPDNIYRIAAVDPAFCYRISGRFSAERPCEFSISALPAQIGDGTVGNTLGIVTTEGIDINADGRFEIIADASPVEGRRNHLPIAGAQTLQARDTLADWETQRPASLAIERIEGPARDDFDADHAAARMAYLSATIARFFFKVVQHGMCEAAPENTLPPVMSSAARGGLLTQAATLGCYRIAPDEALIITANPLGARYIGMQIVDLWMVSHDYRRHTSSLNHLQAPPDADGRIRWVISIDDPGVHNWLDGSGAAAGAVLLRWQQLPGNVQFEDAVSTELVKLKTLRTHLPGETRFVTFAERSAQQDVRENGYLTRVR